MLKSGIYIDQYSGYIQKERLVFRKLRFILIISVFSTAVLGQFQIMSKEKPSEETLVFIQQEMVDDSFQVDDLLRSWENKCEQIIACNQLAVEQNNEQLIKESFAVYAVCVYEDPRRSFVNQLEELKELSRIKPELGVYELFHLAAQARVESKFEDVIDYLLRAIPLAKEESQAITLIYLYNIIGNLLYNYDATDQCIEITQKMIDLSRKNNFDSGLLVAYNRIANAYNPEQQDSSLKYFELADEVGKRFDSGYFKYEHLSNQGHKENIKENFIAARDLYKESFTEAVSINDTSSMLLSLDYIAGTQIDLKDYRSALDSYERMLAIHDREETRLEMEDYYTDRAFVEAELGDFESAYYNLEKKIEHEQKYYDDHVVNKILELEEAYQSAKKEAVIVQQELDIERQGNQNKALMGGLLILAGAGFGGFMLLRNRRRLNEERIKNLEQQQKLMAIDFMVQGQEAERKRIAQDLHDGLGGLLASARMQMQTVQKEIDKLSEMKLFNKAEALIDDACVEVRRIAHDMMPDALVNLGFVEAVNDVAVDITNSSDITVKCYFSNPEMTFSDTHSMVMYRVIQEITNNALKHSKATEMLIQCIEDEDAFHFTIEDNGIGFDRDIVASGEGMGLQNIESRVKYLNGEIVLETAPGEGLSYQITIPRK